MNITNSIFIQRPIADVWDVLGNKFGEIHKWSSHVKHSGGSGRPVHDGVCEQRACDIKGMGKIREKVTSFDPVNHVLAYEVVEGFPFFVKRGVNRWTLTSDGGDRTRVDMIAELQTTGIVGAMMAPMMKMKMGGMLKTVADDLKYFVENGKPHPRKLRALANH